MGTDKRARQKANRQTRLAEAEAEATKEVRERSTKRIGVFVGIGAAIVGLFVLFSLFTGGDDDNASAISFAPTAVPEEGEDSVPVDVELLSSLPDDFAPFAGDGSLAAVTPAARNGAYAAAPELTIDPAKNYAAAFNTTAGTIRLNLFAAEAPITVNNFVNLARDGYYDGTVFHRVLSEFMAQAGDPTGTGTGGPGYQFEDEFSDTLVFDRPGLLAMANAGAATNGSQFFITFEDNPSTRNLTNKHTIFGELVGDIAILDNIVRVDPTSPDPDQAPLTVINSVSIVESN